MIPIETRYDKSIAALPQPARKYCNYLNHMNRSRQTIFQYSQDLLGFFRYMKVIREGRSPGDADEQTDVSDLTMEFVASVTTDDLYDYLMYVSSDRGNQAASRARKLSSIRGFFKYLVVIDRSLPANPAEHISTPAVKKKLPKYLTEKEARDLLQTVATDYDAHNRVRDYAIITLFLNCGLRLSELAGISLRDLDPELSSMRVLGKGSKERIVYLNDACKLALLDYLRERAADPNVRDRDALFLSRLGKRISYRTVQETVYKYLAQAGLGYKHFSTHKLRHTAATLMYQSGQVDLRVLKDILGHEQLSTTQIYTHVSDSQMEAAMGKNPLAEIHLKDTGKEDPEL